MKVFRYISYWYYMYITISKYIIGRSHIVINNHLVVTQKTITRSQIYVVINNHLFITKKMINNSINVYKILETTSKLYTKQKHTDN